jgi:hypothetical protein
MLPCIAAVGREQSRLTKRLALLVVASSATKKLPQYQPKTDNNTGAFNVAVNELHR